MYQCSEMLIRVKVVEKALVGPAYAVHWNGEKSVANTWHTESEAIFHGNMNEIEMLSGERWINKHRLRSIEMEPTTPHHFKMNRALANRVSFGFVIRDKNGAVMVACRHQLPLKVINYRWQPTYHWKPWTSIKILELWTWLMVTESANSSLHCSTQRNFAYWRFQICWNLFDLLLHWSIL